MEHALSAHLKTTLAQYSSVSFMDVQYQCQPRPCHCRHLFQQYDKDSPLDKLDIEIQIIRNKKQLSNNNI